VFEISGRPINNVYEKFSRSMLIFMIFIWNLLCCLKNCDSWLKIYFAHCFIKKNKIIIHVNNQRNSMLPSNGFPLRVILFCDCPLYWKSFILFNYGCRFSEIHRENMRRPLHHLV
jgi:hypothetical protein